MLTNRLIGFKLQTLWHPFVILNLNLCCDDPSLILLHEFQSNMQNYSNFIYDKPFDDISIFSDINADAFKGRFFNNFEHQMFAHSLSFCGVMQWPASAPTYQSQNCSATTSWLDHIVYSNPQLVSQIRILYDDTLHDHIPIYYEMTIPRNNLETILQDQNYEKLLQ